MPAHSRAFTPSLRKSDVYDGSKAANDAALPVEEEIIMPVVGDRLWYWQKDAREPLPMIVSKVHSVSSVTGAFIQRDGWYSPAQRVFLRQRASEEPRPPYCEWPREKLHT